MQTVTLTTQLRSGRGKGAARRLRTTGQVPAVFYGPRTEAVAISFGSKEFAERLAKHERAPLIQFESDSVEINGRVALVKDLQQDALSGAVIHADLYEVDMQKSIRVPVPLHFVGKPAGVVRGGILQPIVREVEVECLPGDIPEFLEIDVSGLDLQESVHVSQLTLPAGITAHFEDDFAVVTIVAPTGEGAAGEGPTSEAAPHA